MMSGTPCARRAALGGNAARLRLGRCAAAPPVQVERRTSPLTKKELVDYLRSGCKTRDKWRIGTEHEKLGFFLADGRRIGYNEIEAVMNRLVSRFGWQPMMEEGKIIGCKLDGQSVTIEPGGQLELSGAPLENLHQTCSEVNSHLYQVKAISEELQVGFLGVGFDPKWDLDQIPMMPKGRYNIMRKYMPKVGTMGHDMMFRSCTIQVNLDFESEEDMIEKFRIGLALQPIATALFALSPFRNGAPSGYQSWRSHVWTDVDNNRCGTLPFVFDDDFGFEKYAEYVLDVPMYFAYRDHKYYDATGLSFRDFINGELSVVPGEFASMGDWESHLTTVFPEVRLKRYLEMRGADGGPWRMICALPAFWVGLLYDAASQRKCLELISTWTHEEREYLRAEVPVTGLRTPFRDGLVLDVAKEALRISREGLEARGQGEAVFLQQLEKIVTTGKSPAEGLLALYESEWGHSVDPIYKYMDY